MSYKERKGLDKENGKINRGGGERKGEKRKRGLSFLLNSRGTIVSFINQGSRGVGRKRPGNRRFQELIREKEAPNLRGKLAFFSLIQQKKKKKRDQEPRGRKGATEGGEGNARLSFSSWGGMYYAVGREDKGGRPCQRGTRDGIKRGEKRKDWHQKKKKKVVSTSYVGGGGGSFWKLKWLREDGWG